MPKKLLLSISAIALAAGTASAQVIIGGPGTSAPPIPNYYTGPTFSRVFSSSPSNAANVDNSGAKSAISYITQTGERNTAAVAQLGAQHRSTVAQVGSDNLVYHEQRNSRNNVYSTQTGEDHRSYVVQGGERNSASVRQVGVANRSVVFQGAKLGADLTGYQAGFEVERSTVIVDQAGTNLSSEIEQLKAGVNGAPGEYTAASANYALVYQRGVPADASGGTTLGSVVRQNSGGNYAWVYQYDGGADAPNLSTVVQRYSQAQAGQSVTSNLARVTQSGRGNLSDVLQDGFRNSVTVSMEGGGAGEAGNKASATQDGRMQVMILAQDGTSNAIDAAQAGEGGSSAWLKQEEASVRNSIQLTQGGTDAGSINLSADVTQRGTLNSASIVQDGRGHGVFVRQLGSGVADVAGATGTAGTFLNSVNIRQSGLGQSARVYQAPEVGPSSGSSADAANPASGNGQEFGFVGGRRSAEVTIIQSNLANFASVEQFGRGQVARIEQSGTSGQAIIFQGADATNATAIIRQTGNGNKYEIRQNTAGEYLSITQTGNGNSVSNMASDGPAG